MINYFSHDSNARNDQKVTDLRIDHHATGYGIYFMILEKLRDEDNYMLTTNYKSIAYDLHEDVELVKSVVEDYDLFKFTEDGKRFYSESLMNRMELKDAKSKRRAAAGKKGASKRWAGKDKPSETVDADVVEPSNEDGNATTESIDENGTEISLPSDGNGNDITKPSKNMASKVKESKVNKSNKESSPKKSKTDFSEDSTEFKLANHLYQKILENNPEFKKPNLQKWANPIRLMIERDGRKPVQIKNMIEWAQGNDFWWSNILSTAKLRSQYDTLKSQALAETMPKGRSSGTGKPHETIPDDWDNYTPKAPKQEDVESIHAQLEQLKASQEAT